MTAKVISLAKARKARDKTNKSADAKANRAKFGRTKAERDADTSAAERDRKALDAQRLDRKTGPGGDSGA